MEKIVSTDKARQGSQGRPVLMVLVAALILVAIVWAGVEIYGEQIDTRSDAQTTTTAPDTTTTAPVETTAPAATTAPATAAPQ